MPEMLMVERAPPPGTPVGPLVTEDWETAVPEVGSDTPDVLVLKPGCGGAYVPLLAMVPNGPTCMRGSNQRHKEVTGELTKK